MKKLSHILFSVLIPFIFGCKTQQSDSITLIDKAELEELLKDKDVQLVDVRTIPEVEAGFINNAENIVWDSNFTNKVSNLDKTKPVVLYCKRGGRSAKAASALSKLGFTDIYDLKGGYDTYIK